MNPDFTDAPDDRWSVRITRHYRHPIQKVWSAVTSPEHLAEWFPSTVKFDTAEPVVGTVIQFGEPMAGYPAQSGMVTDYDPPNRLGFTWGTDHLCFELAAVDDGTDLVLIHRFDDRAGAASFATGWESCLQGLSAHLDGDPPPLPDRAESRHEELAAVFGLDQPVVDVENDGHWRITFERQLVVPTEVAWRLIIGTEPDTGQPRSDPVPGDPVRRWDSPGYELGTVTATDPGRMVAWATSPGEPGDSVRAEFTAGTGHGARLLVAVEGSDTDERDRARDEWHEFVVNTATEARAQAAHTPRPDGVARRG